MRHTVEDNPERNRYELRVDGDLAGWAEYLPGGDSTIIAHTEIASAYEGKGLGGELVAGTLDRIRASGKTVIPTCPFAAGYIREHPEYADLVVASLRDSFS